MKKKTYIISWSAFARHTYFVETNGMPLAFIILDMLFTGREPVFED